MCPNTISGFLAGGSDLVGLRGAENRPFPGDAAAAGANQRFHWMRLAVLEGRDLAHPGQLAPNTKKPQREKACQRDIFITLA